MISKAGKIFVGVCFAIGLYLMLTEAGPWVIEKAEDIGNIIQAIKDAF